MRRRYFRVLHFNEMIAHGWWLIFATTSLDIKEMIFFMLTKDGTLIHVCFPVLASVAPCIPKALPVSRGVKQIDP